jgi:DNA-binding transcriptional LysR family regulator
MTLDQLRYFIEAAKFEHIGKAAQTLHITPGAVSTAVLALEEELKKPLFAREGRGIRLNADGKFLREQAESILERLNQVRFKLQGDSREVEGHYRVGGSHFLSTRYLAKAWTHLQSTHPKISGELCSLPTFEVMNDVLGGKLDLGLCFSPLAHPDLKQSLLHQGDLMIAVRKGHPVMKRKNAFTMQSLNSFPATVHKSAPGVDICETHPNFAKQGITPKIRFQFDNDDLAVANLRASDSWALLPDIVIRSSPELVAVPHPRGWSAPYSVAMIARNSSTRELVSTLIVEELKGCFS